MVIKKELYYEVSGERRTHVGLSVMSQNTIKATREFLKRASVHELKIKPITERFCVSGPQLHSLAAYLGQHLVTSLGPDFLLMCVFAQICQRGPITFH